MSVSPDVFMARWQGREGGQERANYAVISMLIGTTEALSATALAARFRKGPGVLPQIEAVLAALVRVGGLVYSPDGGRAFLSRRAA